MFKLNEIQPHSFVEVQIGFWFAPKHFCCIAYLKSVAANSLICITESPLWMIKNLLCWTTYFFLLGSVLKEIGGWFCWGWNLGGMFWISEKPLDIWGWPEGEVSASFVLWFKFSGDFLCENIMSNEDFWICQMQFFNKTDAITKQIYSKFRKNDQSQVFKAGKQVKVLTYAQDFRFISIRTEILYRNS